MLPEQYDRLTRTRGRRLSHDDGSRKASAHTQMEALWFVGKAGMGAVAIMLGLPKGIVLAKSDILRALPEHDISAMSETGSACNEVC
jgi:hypothetical protein